MNYVILSLDQSAYAEKRQFVDYLTGLGVKYSTSYDCNYYERGLFTIKESDLNLIRLTCPHEISSHYNSIYMVHNKKE